jgi:DNA-binding GntR family transcriptional regulator
VVSFGRPMSSKPRTSVFQVMREQIVTGKRPAGSRLVERGLCEEFGVSRTAVRESLIRLADSGLVSVVPDAGATVEAVTLERIIDAYVYRAAIEPAAAEQCATRMNREQTDQLRKIAAEFPDEYLVACSGKPHRLLDLEDAFHGLIIEGSANIFLRRGWEIARLHLFRGVKAHPDSIANKNSRTAIVDDHIAIASAVHDGDGERAAQCMREHIERGHSPLIERLRNLHAWNSPVPRKKARTP